MSRSTAKTFLMYSTDDGTTYTKLVDITSFPDLGSTPAKLDTTTLSAEKVRTYILGLQEIPDLVFEANFDKTTFDTINGLTDKYKFQLQFGTDGVDGGFEWDGEVRVYTSGGGVDEVVKMQVICSAESEIVPMA